VSRQVKAKDQDIAGSNIQGKGSPGGLVLAEKNSTYVFLTVIALITRVRSVKGARPDLFRHDLLDS
jgi:hypothetical protein